MRKFLFPSLLAFLFFSCQKEVDVKLDQPNEVISKENERLSAAITKQTTSTWLNGQIVDEQNQPIAGASVSCAGKTTTTDNNGFFYFKTILTVNKDYALITVTKPGYMNGFRTFTPNRRRLAYHTEKIMLQLAGVPKFVPSSGGTVTSDNVKLTFPAGSVIKPGGYAFNGNIKVVIRYINPGSPNFALMIPGTLSGLNSAGRINALQSFGMASVELTDQNGSKLEIAPGQTVKMEMPAAATDPASIPLWHFNETYGIWVQQGTATRQGNVFVAEVNHFSIWNIDLEFNSFELTVKLQTVDSTPVANQLVKVYRPNNVFVKNFFTDNAGEATLINCPSNESLTLKIAFPCDTITHTMAPVTQSRTETVTLSGPAITSYELMGTLYQCNNQALPNQPFQVFLTGPNSFTVLNGISSATGQFEIGTVIPTCQATGLNAQATAYFNNQYYFSSNSSIAPGVNIYNPVLCDSIGGGGQYNDSDVVNIPDPSLRAGVRQAINKPTGTIYYIDVKNLNILSFANNPPSPKIQSLVGLNYLTGLDTLDLFNSLNNITSIAQLSGLTQLKFLSLSPDTLNTLQLSDLTPLQNLTQLQDLDLRSCGVSNIGPLQNLTQLIYLDLEDNNISNLAPLQNLSGLLSLFLDQNQIVSVPALNMPNLEYLSMDYNAITTLAAPLTLPALQELHMSGNQLSNISNLQNLPSLQNLTLDNNQISNITPLQNITQLRSLHIGGNQISNVTPLQNLASLEILVIGNNQISTIASLVNGVPALTYFYVTSGNTIPANEITAFLATHPNCAVL